MIYYHKYGAKVLLFEQICKKIIKKYQKSDFFIKIIRIIEIFFVPLQRISIQPLKLSVKLNDKQICIV